MKKLSILGDSISTYRGVSNDASANSELFYNLYHYDDPFPQGRTYWGLLLTSLGLELCVNNSYSGGNLSGREFEFSGVNRARHLSRDDGGEPDLIIVFMGINDLGRGVEASVFAEDYERVLQTIAQKHPQAHVCCANIFDRSIFLHERAVAFNLAIEKAVERAGKNFFIADMFGSRMRGDFYYNNTMDGLHPDEDGMKIIADVFEDAIKRHFAE